MSDDTNEKIRKALEECGKSTEKSALAKIDDATDGGVGRMLTKLFGKRDPIEAMVTPAWPGASSNERGMVN
jgi:hypothetical protein